MPVLDEMFPQAADPRDQSTHSPSRSSSHRAAAAEINAVTRKVRHDVAIVFGSGWVPAADALGSASHEFPMSSLAGFARPTVSGHSGQVRSIEVAGRQVLAFLGRTHLYEGRGVEAVVHAVRTAVAAGCKTVILTNAAGALRADLRVGDPVLLSDHINLTGRTPLVGPTFVDLTDLYSIRLRQLVRAIDPAVKEGIYAQFQGPQYETPAEVAMAGLLGADLVGMSTALEAIAAHADGAEVLALSLVTNVAAGISDAPLEHAEVLATGHSSAGRMGDLLVQLIAKL